MESFKSIIIILLLVFGLLTPTVQAKTAGLLLQEGLYAEEMEGNLDKAMEIYEQIIADKSASKDFKAQAMYRLGICHVKRQEKHQARAIFEKLIVQYPEQTALIEKVKPLVEETSYYDPAALMPPETKIYIEIGSPGKQIETILNMLEGTPFENPLAAIGAGRRSQQSQKKPTEILAALLNPSMIAEFKKIRGIALGITELRQNNPPMVIVLYPGKSDAIRGILLAALGMVATSSEPIEGMQTLQIQNQAGIAYDDNVIIIAQPLEQWKWCIKQYKGISDQPTLVSENKAFAKINGKNREENALTFWVDVDSTYAFVKENIFGGKPSMELRMADTIGDINNIDDLIANLSIGEKTIGLEANLNFKQGHNCLAYNLIRTPNITRDGFEAVPSQAVAIASFALSEQQIANPGTMQKTLKQLTGLDIGREVFANIEQVTFFVLPPSTTLSQSVLAKQISPILPSIGVAITSHNSAQTFQLLTKLLTTADSITNTTLSAESNKPINLDTNKYQIGSVNNVPIYCYIGQVGKSTIITLSPEILQTCMSVPENQQSVLTAGPLQQPLSKVSPKINKLALVNVAGALRLANAHFHKAIAATDDPNMQLPLSKLLNQLAQNCENTSIRLFTSEELNSLTLKVGLDEIPPLGPIFSMLVQLPGAIPENLTTKAIKPAPSNKAKVSPTDQFQLSWLPGISATKHKIYLGTNKDELALLGEVTTPKYDEVPELQKDTTYYWRVDEVQADGSVVTGDIWSFTGGELIGWWKLDENEGLAVSDSLGLGNDGKLVADSFWQPDAGRIDGAIRFDGGGGHIEIGNESNFDITNQITVSAWVKFIDVVHDWAGIVTKGNSAWRLSAMQSTGAIHFACTGVSPPWVNGRVNINDGQWHHVAGVYDGSKMYLYIDGVEDISANASGNINTNNYNVWIGGNAEATALRWKGAIDDVRIYNYALSNDEVTSIYKSVPQAIAPYPADGATASLSTNLSWSAGVNAVMHRVYFGTNADELPLLAEVNSPNYDKVTELKEDTTYYWRVDEVQADGSVVTGDIWSFTGGELIVWWKLDEKSGDRAGDSSSENNIAKLYNDPIWQPANGRIDGALMFDGIDDYAQTSDDLNKLQIENDYTLAAWIKPDGTQKNVAGIISKSDVDGHWTLQFDWTSDKKIIIHHPRAWWATGITLNQIANTWHHVAVARRGDVMTSYLDGKKVRSGTLRDKPGSGRGHLNLGAESTASSSYVYKGMIDDVRIYNYPLRAEEIEAIYNTTD